MVQVVHGGIHDFNAVVFGEKNQATINFLEHRLSNLSQSVTDAGAAFLQRGRELFEKYNGSEAIRMAKAAIRHVQHAFQTDSIRQLKNIGELQQAPMTMMRWIMACPEVRQLYHLQRLDGYSHIYQDTQPNVVGERHYDYRQVMNGVMQPSDEEDAEYMFVNYFEAGESDDAELELKEQVDIISTWDLIKSMLAPGKEDPTSAYCTTQ